MASVIILFLLGGIYLQQYLSKLFRPGLLPNECMHSRGIQLREQGLIIIIIFFFFAGERGEVVRGLSLCMTCNVCYLLLGLNEGFG